MPTQLLIDIQRLFKALCHAEQAVHMKAYMLNQFEFMGIRAIKRRHALKAVLVNEPSSLFTRTGVLNLAMQLWKLPEREFQYAAIDILNWKHKTLLLKDLEPLLKLLQQKSWWDTVDSLAGVIGDVLLQHKSLNPHAQQRMDDCLIHPYLWVRRVAMIHQLGWKTQTDENRLFSYALTLAPETDFFIRKAIGWALRDHARTRPQEVRAFLKKQQSVLSRLTLKEAGKHL